MTIAVLSQLFNILRGLSLAEKVGRTTNTLLTKTFLFHVSVKTLIIIDSE